MLQYTGYSDQTHRQADRAVFLLSLRILTGSLRRSSFSVRVRSRDIQSQEVLFQETDDQVLSIPVNKPRPVVLRPASAKGSVTVR